MIFLAGRITRPGRPLSSLAWPLAPAAERTTAAGVRLVVEIDAQRREFLLAFIYPRDRIVGLDDLGKRRDNRKPAFLVLETPGCDVASRSAT